MTTAAPAIQSTPPPPPDLNDDVVTEILLCLPSASVLRCRAVCRAWRAISISPGFVAAYARRRPLELIVRRHGADDVVDTIPVATLDVERRRCVHLVGYPACTTTGTGRPTGRFHYLMGSCNGLLLFDTTTSFYGNDNWVCNPATRQWKAIVPPRSDRHTRSCGFYLHKPSGEHRAPVPYQRRRSRRHGLMGTSASHYVLSLEAGETRRLGPAAATVHMYTQILIECLHHRGKLHWLSHPEVEKTDKILVFDTVSEAFRRMSRPPSVNRYREPTSLLLLEMDRQLAMAAVSSGSMHIDLWVLEDYSNAESWTRRHRVDLPPPLRHAGWAMMVRQNAILLGCSTGHAAALYDLTEKRVLKQMQLPLTDHLTGHVFRESLERHAFFDLQEQS